MKIFNTLTRSKDELVPLTAGEIRMYVCGVTVYDLSHIGHARSAIVFDVIRRYLLFKGYRVTFVKNYTDVDDKIIRRANEQGISSRELSERYIEAYRADMAALGVLPGDVEPKATEHIPQMIRLIEGLIAKDVAYVVDGDVYFEVRRFSPYGRLSGKNLDELLAGARVEVDERKRDPRDFALWKSAKPNEPSWPSPWGPGRPGWHIECSAMSMQYLGESFDIHGGGEDLIFPHHECEIAQSEAETGKPFATYWMHNGFVNLAAEKMSKSLGNILTIRDFVARHDPEAFRLYLLGTHYRSPVEFAEERVEESARALERLRVLAEASGRPAAAPGDGHGTGAELPRLLAGVRDPGLAGALRTHADRFVQAMDDDFNTPAALGALFDLSRELYRYRDAGAADPGRADTLRAGSDVLVALGAALGLLGPRAAAARPAGVESAVERLLGEREDARRRRDWKRADEIRQEALALGASIEDTPAGPRIRWKSP